MRFHTRLAVVMALLVAASLGGMAFTLVRESGERIAEQRRRHGERVVRILSLGQTLSERAMARTRARLAAVSEAVDALTSAAAGRPLAERLAEARERANATGIRLPLAAFRGEGRPRQPGWTAIGGPGPAGIYVEEDVLERSAGAQGLRPLLEMVLEAPDALGVAVVGEGGEILLNAGPQGRPAEGPLPPGVLAAAREHLAAGEPTAPVPRALDGEAVMVLTIPHPIGQGRAALLYRYQAEGGAGLPRGSAAALIWSEAAVALAASVLGAFWLSRGLSRPLERLVRGVQAYGAGDLSRRVDPGKRAPREIRRLSREFNGMADAIQQSMADIERETRQREQLESELRIAATLQQEMLPGGPYDGPGVELTGWSRPARQVGGDFYDYAGLGGDRLGVAVGDATDKGLPAALLVTECWSACEALFGGSHAPGEILGRVNEVMHGRLKGCGRFVTLLFLAIDEAAGELTFASAGHHPPFLVRADGSVEGLKPSPGFPIGIVEAASYGESRLACEAGDAVALYTDGVTDARSPDGELYGEGRLAAALARCAGQPAAAMAEGVRADIENYTGGSEPYDDMTLVVLRFK